MGFLRSLLTLFGAFEFLDDIVFGKKSYGCGWFILLSPFLILLLIIPLYLISIFFAIKGWAGLAMSTAMKPSMIGVSLLIGAMFAFVIMLVVPSIFPEGGGIPLIGFFYLYIVGLGAAICTK